MGVNRQRSGFRTGFVRLKLNVGVLYECARRDVEAGKPHPDDLLVRTVEDQFQVTTAQRHTSRRLFLCIIGACGNPRLNRGWTAEIHWIDCQRKSRFDEQCWVAGVGGTDRDIR